MVNNSEYSIELKANSIAESDEPETVWSDQSDSPSTNVVSDEEPSEPKQGLLILGNVCQIFLPL